MILVLEYSNLVGRAKSGGSKTTDNVTFLIDHQGNIQPCYGVITASETNMGTKQKICWYILGLVDGFNDRSTLYPHVLYTYISGIEKPAFRVVQAASLMTLDCSLEPIKDVGLPAGWQYADHKEVDRYIRLNCLEKNEVLLFPGS